MTNKSISLILIGVLLATITVVLSGCTKKLVETPDPEPAAPLTMVKARWELKSSKNKAWTEHTYKEIGKIGKELLKSNPKDIKDFCPNYSSLSTHNKTNFWVMLLSGISEFESAHRPSVKYKESFKDQNDDNIYSRGLLQLSIESSRGYKCGFKNGEAIHEPLQNLTCGIIILDRWIGRDKVMTGYKYVGSKKQWLGGGRYWSVMRKLTRRKSISGWTKEFCASVK